MADDIVQIIREIQEATGWTGPMLTPGPNGEWREIEVSVDGETQTWKAFATYDDAGIWEYAIDFSDESQRVK